MPRFLSYRQLLGRSPKSASGTGHKAPRRRPCRLILEPLEGRLAPAATSLTTPGSLIYVAPAGTGHNLVLRLNGPNIELIDNNALVQSQPLAATDAVRLYGPAGAANTLTVDNAFGGLLAVPLGIGFDGGAGGNNALIVTGTVGGDTLQLTATTCVLDDSQAVYFVNVPAVTVHGGPGDVAFLYDSPGDNVFRGTGSYSFLEGSGFLHTVVGFAQVTAPAGAGGTDQALLYDDVGGARFVAQGNYSRMTTADCTVVLGQWSSVRATNTTGATDYLQL
jgi:hypothetical protein